MHGETLRLFLPSLTVSSYHLSHTALPNLTRADDHR